ncbi:polyphosphate kinase 2 family protein [Microlunatus elymi]|uniref:Polyphosphate kinase 2 family protein n=1 Tax=Microlunatus elymi TaxID=2596828 RepID=A0A516Q3U7_9ACTN|nr:PPK2 family polyphosphate kinase [Microlunatus elymi]QDP98097.1 polyphosphate kinase 2 family protein [Microlunatus elymi]
MTHQELRRALRVEPENGLVDLGDYSTDRVHVGPKSKKKSQHRLDAMADGLAELQERLYAAATDGDHRSVLLVLQGMDTAGKGGVIDHVVGLVGPSGTQIRAFKQPTAAERKHNFLWRIRKALPAAGMIGVFDRSHYEDVLVPVVHDQLDDAERRHRYKLINDFEAELSESGTTLIKCFLNVSYDRQRDRLLARLDDPTKYWKFNEGDIDSRRQWPDYRWAYAEALAATSTEIAPWYAVPSDHKWYRNWAVATLLLDTLRDLDPQYPLTDLDLPRLRKRLAPPN